MNLEKTLSLITGADLAAMRSAQHRLDSLAKPRGSLGRLEELAVKLAGIVCRRIGRIWRFSSGEDRRGRRRAGTGETST